jgi:hypothetical protein
MKLAHSGYGLSSLACQNDGIIPEWSGQENRMEAPANTEDLPHP